MKNFISPLVLILLTTLLLTACSNSDDTESFIPIIDDTTYTGTIKSIIDTNCLNCHTDPPVNGAPMPLITYLNVKDAVQNRGLIGRVENGTMPPNGTLSAAQIQAIKDWQTDGLPE